MEKVYGFKGFNKDLQCLFFQYEIGKTYTKDDSEDISLCSNGFHFCENPFDIFNYYPPMEGNRYCQVIGSGKMIKGITDSKLAVQKIEIIKELTLKELIQEGIKYIKGEGENNIPKREDGMDTATADYD